MSEIVVVGSLNMDLVVRAARMPDAGETITGKEFHLIPGGKGANQAVAAARMGVATSLVGRIGQDVFGQALLDSLATSQVDVTQILALESVSTGTATVLVDAQGENRIIVVPGANACLQPDDVTDIEGLIENASAIVMQFEIPIETILRIAEIAHRNGVKVIINPAPARIIPAELYACTDVLILNESEASFLASVAIKELTDAFLASEKLLMKGAKTVILTLGKRGAILTSPNERFHVPAIPVKVVDTTAAGDSFVGGFAACLVLGYALETALRYAVCDGCLAVTKLGAQLSIPDKDAVIDVLPKSRIIRWSQRGGAYHH
ncbi:MAG: ribokinase [Chloroflexi bacterium]|nr:ribokinase [Chloroflexota bacterium]